MGVGTSIILTLPELRSAWAGMDRRLRPQGIVIDVAPFGGQRTAADTVKIMRYRDADWTKLSAAERARYGSKEAWRPINPYGTSHHNFGGAIDFRIVAYPKGATYSQAYARVIEAARAEGLRANFIANDPNHTQLNLTLAQVKARYEQYSRNLRQNLTFLGLAAVAVAVMLVRA